MSALAAVSVKKNIEFIDLAAQQARIGKGIEQAIATVLRHGNYIMGPEVKAFEQKLSAFCGAKNSISCANGTDALMLALKALNLKTGTAVFVPSFTFAATAEVVAMAGAVPVFVDVLPDTFNIDPKSLEAGIATAKKLGLEAAGIIAVDLFGQPADYDQILPVAASNGLWVIADAAQSFGATYRGLNVGQLCTLTTTSFFPAKPLGCYGDGGAIFTDNAEITETLNSLRVHGKGTDKYDNVRIGFNSRLDTLQAAILIEKIGVFADEIQSRQKVADTYTKGLKDVCVTPVVIEGASSVWAQYTLKLEGRNRDAFAAALKQKGIPTAVYYPKPLHMQTAYKSYPVAGAALGVSEALSSDVISLPMHPYLEADAQDFIIASVKEALSKI